MNRFEKIFEYLISVEGGYSNDKHDKGGETKYGIIESEARKHGYKGDMRKLTLDFAKNIYEKKYFHGNRLHEIEDDRISLSICDWIVNSGNWGAKKAQAVLNEMGYNLAVDGIIGNRTLEALNGINSEEFLKAYHQSQRAFYQSIVNKNNTQRVFLKGWLNRVVIKEKFLKDNF